MKNIKKEIYFSRRKGHSVSSSYQSLSTRIKHVEGVLAHALSIAEATEDL